MSSSRFVLCASYIAFSLFACWKGEVGNFVEFPQAVIKLFRKSNFNLTLFGCEQSTLAFSQRKQSLHQLFSTFHVSSA